MDKIKVMLVENHVLVREGTRELLDQEKGLQVVAEAGDGEEAVQLAAIHRPDVVIMDIAMHKLNGIEATRQEVLSAVSSSEYSHESSLDSTPR